MNNQKDADEIETNSTSRGGLEKQDMQDGLNICRQISPTEARRLLKKERTKLARNEAQQT